VASARWPRGAAPRGAAEGRLVEGEVGVLPDSALIIKIA